MQIYNKGITTIGSVISIIIVIVVLGAGGYYFYKGSLGSRDMIYPQDSINKQSTNKEGVKDQDNYKGLDACEYFTIDDVRKNLSADIVKSDLLMNADANCDYEYLTTNGTKEIIASFYIVYSGPEADEFIRVNHPGGADETLGEVRIFGIGDQAILIRPVVPLGFSPEAKVMFVINNKGVYIVSVSDRGTYEQNSIKAQNLAKAVISHL